jgi:hypothetical protein
MSEAWIAFGLCIVLVLGAAIPLLKDRNSQKAPPPPPKETLRDWRNDK